MYGYIACRYVHTHVRCAMCPAYAVSALAYVHYAVIVNADNQMVYYVGMYVM